MTSRWVRGSPFSSRWSWSSAIGRQRSSTSAVGSPDTSSGDASRCSAQSRSRVSRASEGSSETTFISVSLKSEWAFRFAEPTVNHVSSTIPIFACT